MSVHTLSAVAEQQPMLDAVVIGAGFAGMYMLYRLRQLGLSTQVFEAGADVGGTWYWNRYPGARCDIESLDYQYSFSDELQREWTWTERYASQPEILAYASHVADRFNLRENIRFSTRVTGVCFDETNECWNVLTADGKRIGARYLIAATGALSLPTRPEIPGLDRFGGAWFHTGQWPHEGADFSSQRVAVLGTGSSGIQAIPVIAQQADHVFVLQRTPHFTAPANNHPLSAGEVAEHKAKFAELKKMASSTFGGFYVEPPTLSALEVEPAARVKRYEERWTKGALNLQGTFNDLMTTEAANETLADFMRSKIRQRVQDQSIAEVLTPRGYPCGAKRMCIDTGYYETFNRSNVTLVNLTQTPIVEIAERFIRTSSGEYDVDAIVFATGFDALTGPLLAINPIGRGGLPLSVAWEAGPRTYLGLGISGFPNLFMIAGPGSPSSLTNMIMAIEQHVDWIADCLAEMKSRGVVTIEALPDAQNAWVEHVNEVAKRTLYAKGNSWYLGANVPGKPRIFMPYCGGLGVYRETCDKIAANGYEGFSIL